jgi:hypothetical protein
MSALPRCRRAVSSVVAVLLLTLTAPIVVHADDQIIVDAHILAAQEQDPDLAPTVPSWDESSGYGSVEASRAAASATLTSNAGPSWDESSGYGAVEASRAEVSALLSDQLLGSQDQTLTFAAAAARSWDETSGYGAVEAIRAVPDEIVAP